MPGHSHGAPRDGLWRRVSLGGGRRLCFHSSSAEWTSNDWNRMMKHAAPFVFSLVLTFAFLLLLLAFRSLAIASKAIGLNLLSVGAAYGALVVVFSGLWRVPAALPVERRDHVMAADLHAGKAPDTARCEHRSARRRVSMARRGSTVRVRPEGSAKAPQAGLLSF
jgi:hypothetical protein